MSLYTPTAFAAADPAALSRLVRDHPFATLVTPAAPEPFVTHLPLLLVADGEPHGTLIGHFARANPHARVAPQAESIAIFHGPHAYVSPTWYTHPTRMVPTWNYVTAHAHGVVETIDDPNAARPILDALARQFEPGESPWQMATAGREVEAMVAGVVAFRMRLSRVEGKFKLSQNRSPEDRQRVIDALDAQADADAVATAAWMRAYAAPPKDAG